MCQRLSVGGHVESKPNNQICRNKSCCHVPEWAAKIEVNLEMGKIDMHSAHLRYIILTRRGERYSGCYWKGQSLRQCNRDHFGSFFELRGCGRFEDRRAIP